VTHPATASGIAKILSFGLMDGWGTICKFSVYGYQVGLHTAIL